MKKYIEAFQYISHDIDQLTQTTQVEWACEAGAKWIQYRCFNKSDKEMIAELQAIGNICDDWGCSLIVTDHIHLKGEADIQGFHIEDIQADMSLIRAKLGDEFTLGGSANTIEQLIKLAHTGADYAGFGPYASSLTKPNTFPTKTAADYSLALNVLRDKDIDFPFVAVGGIQLTDVASLMATGIYGIAASAAIYQAPDFQQAYSLFYKEVNHSKR